MKESVSVRLLNAERKRLRREKILAMFGEMLKKNPSIKPFRMIAAEMEVSERYVRLIVNGDR